MVIRAESPVAAERPGEIAGKRVLVVEDGPTLTHGNMTFGAGVVAARGAGAAEIVDPRAFAAGTLRDVYAQYEVGPVLPAMGYSAQQLADMVETIAAAKPDLGVIASPIDLSRLIELPAPSMRVSYDLRELPGSPTVRDALAPVLDLSDA